MLEKDSLVTISESDKKYTILMKEQVMDVVKVDFQFEDAFYFGKVITMGSNGTLVVKVKGIYGVNDENDLT